MGKLYLALREKGASMRMKKTLPQGVWPHGQLGGQIRRVMGNKLEPAKYIRGGH